MDKYSKKNGLLDYSLLPENIKTDLPEYWNNAFKQKTEIGKIKTILLEWNKYNYQFSSTINYLIENLLDLELIKNNNEILLLYTIKDKEGQERYYVGRNPKNIIIPNKLIKIWNELPDTIKNIYVNLHNGWYDFESESGGLSSIENIIILNEYEWGILDEIKSLPYNLENCIGIFYNGAGNYVCYDIKTKDKNKGFIWFHDNKPNNDIELWAVIDTWTKICIEE